MTAYKLLRVVFIVLFTPITYLNGQDVEAIDKATYNFKYLLTYQPDSTDVHSARSEDMVLSVGSRVSKFQSLNGYLRDSTFNIIKRNTTSTGSSFIDLNSMNLPKTDFSEVIFKDYVSGTITLREKIYTDHLEYEEPLPLFSWIIGQEKQTINGYSCQKATTNYSGRSFEAWFTQEIPISDGPYKFNGLPGLIVKIYDTKKHYVYELLAVKNVYATDITKKKNSFVKTSKIEFTKVRKEFYDNPLAKMEQMGVTITFDDPNQKRKVVEKAKKRNNPIELVIE